MQRPLISQAGLYIVCCRADRDDRLEKGKYEVSNKTFSSYDEACDYASGISSSREPFIACIVKV